MPNTENEEDIMANTDRKTLLQRKPNQGRDC